MWRIWPRARQIIHYYYYAIILSISSVCHSVHACETYCVSRCSTGAFYEDGWLSLPRWEAGFRTVSWDQRAGCRFDLRWGDGANKDEEDHRAERSSGMNHDNQVALRWKNAMIKRPELYKNQTIFRHTKQGKHHSHVGVSEYLEEKGQTEIFSTVVMNNLFCWVRSFKTVFYIA